MLEFALFGRVGAKNCERCGHRSVENCLNLKAHGLVGCNVFESVICGVSGEGADLYCLFCVFLVCAQSRVTKKESNLKN